MNLDLHVLGAGLVPLLFFSLAVFFMTLAVRHFCQTFFKSFTTKPAWRDFYLPTLPIVLGAGFAAVMYMYPFLKEQPTWGTRAFYGMVAGGLSSFVYRMVRAKFGVKTDGSSIPPSSGDAS